MERPAEYKNEQRPLLRVDSGAGDVDTRQPTINVYRDVNRILQNQWPGILSICWMTVGLIASTFMICYVVCRIGYKKPTPMLWNEPKPAGEVFYHQIIQSGGLLPLTFYSSFLSDAALEYPSLRFNIIILFDDSLTSPSQTWKNRGCSNGWKGYVSRDPFDESNKKKLIALEARNANIKVTYMCLSKYMAATPLKYYWRRIHVSYLSFYARIFSVWQNGGIGMDLSAFNNQFNNNFYLNRRIHAILKNHNDGLPVTNYNALLEDMDSEDRRDFINMSNQIINETIQFFNRLFPSMKSNNIDLSINDSVRNTHRLRRDVKLEKNDIEIIRHRSNETNTLPQFVKPNVTYANDQTITSPQVNISNIVQKKFTESQSTRIHTKYIKEHALKKVTQPLSSNWSDKMNRTNATDQEGSQIFWFFDFSVFTDNVQQQKLLPDYESNYNNTNYGLKKKLPTRLALHSEGVFVASVFKQHTFLQRLIFAGLQRLRPVCAISDTFIRHCSGKHKTDWSCAVYRL